METPLSISDKESTFERIWTKEAKKSREKIMQKLEVRGVIPTYQKCKEYWMGEIRPYKSPVTGNVKHLHTEEIKGRRRIDGRTSRLLENQNPRKKRRARH